MNDSFRFLALLNNARGFKKLPMIKTKINAIRSFLDFKQNCIDRQRKGQQLSEEDLEKLKNFSDDMFP